jgi:hypothetical protein
MFARMSVDELKSVIEYHRLGRDLNERHVERVRNLDFGRGNDEGSPRTASPRGR